MDQFEFEKGRGQKIHSFFNEVEARLERLRKAVRSHRQRAEKSKGAGVSTKALTDAAYRVGFDFGEDLKEEFKLGGSIEDVAVAMDLEHRVFSMKAKVAEKSDRRIAYHCREYAWKKYLTPKLCIAIGQAEKGITQALNPRTQHRILQTRTMGKDRCIFEAQI